MRRPVDPDATQISFSKPRFKLSPSGKKFAVVVMKGNLTTGRNEYQLLLFDTADVLDYIGAPDRSSLPRQQVLVHMEAARYQYSIDHGIDAVRWQADDRTIAFIGRDHADVRQVFTVDTQTGSLHQLTKHPTNIAMFDLSLSGRTVVYAARVPPDWTLRNEFGYAVKSEWMQDLGKDNPKDATVEIKYFALHLDTNSVVPVQAPVGILPRVISLAPNGRRAVIFAPVEGLRDEWAGYMTLEHKSEQSANVALLIDQDAWGGTSPWIGQFLLVDTVSGTTRPLIDAPAKLDVISEAMWSRDGSSVAIASSYMPLDVPDVGERKRRARRPAIVDVSVATGEPVRIVDSDDPESAGREQRIVGVERLPDDSLVVWRNSGTPSAASASRFEKKGSRWVEAPYAPHDQRRLQLQVVQSLNGPPEIGALSTESGKQRLITDLNPRFKTLEMAHAEEFGWKDRWGRSFKGALVYPAHFRQGERYPLVLQAATAHFTPEIFLMDGFAWTTSAFAARPLANRDLLVLQMPSPLPRDGWDPTAVSTAEWWRDGEAPRFTAMMEGAIDTLSESGMADPKRVGLIGFSRSAMYVSHAIAFSHYPIAAATIADGLAPTPFGQTVFYGVPNGMLEFEQDSFIGAPFLGDGLRIWIERSPFFHLDRIRTPLRIESYGLGVPPYWDLFAMLKRHQSPVELIHIPHAHHVLTTPRARYTSQQGNVDWFAYWLRNDVEPGPEKDAQYARWHKLRTLQQAQDVRSEMH